MNPTLRRLLTFCGLLAIFTLLRFPYGDLIEERLQDAQIVAAAQGHHFTFDEFDFFFPNAVVLRNLNFKVQSAIGPIPLTFPDVEGSLNLLPLLLLRASSDIHASFLGGTITGDLAKSIWGNEVRSNLIATGVSIGQHPLLALYRAAGTISGSLKARLDLEANSVSDLDLVLSLSEGHLPRGVKVAGLITLPEVSDVKLDAHIISEDASLALESFALTSSIGSLNASGSVLAPWNGNPLGSYNLSARIELTDEARKTFGGFLALAAGKNPDSAGNIYEILASRQFNELPRTKVHQID